MSELEGWELTQAVMIMVRATIEAGHKPVKVVMHPTDLEAMRDWKGAPVSRDATIYNLPIELDDELEPGKIYCLKRKE